MKEIANISDHSLSVQEQNRSGKPEGSSDNTNTLARLAKFTAAVAQEQVALAKDDANQLSLYLRSATVPVESDPLSYWSLKRESSPELCAVINFSFQFSKIVSLILIITPSLLFFCRSLRSICVYQHHQHLQNDYSLYVH